MRIKYGKIALVILLTVLIWVWADLALDMELTVSDVSINIAKTTPRDLWVSFGDDYSPAASINKVELKGPASRVTAVRRRFNEGTLNLEFFLDPRQQSLIEEGPQQTFNVIRFLRDSEQIEQLGLTVQSCEPMTLRLNVFELVENELEVQCYDEDMNRITAAEVDPPTVSMDTPRSWAGRKLYANVVLTESEQAQARAKGVTKKPFIELSSNGERRRAMDSVNVTLPPEPDKLSEFNLTSATLGFAFSDNLQGKYRVEVDNLSEVVSVVPIRATQEAYQAYQDMTYHIILEIYDEDARNPGEIHTRTPLYNFPAEYVRKNEIQLRNGQTATAQFRLIPISEQQ